MSRLRHRGWWVAALALLGLLAVACRPRVAQYTVTGVIRELKPDGTNVVIKHEAIPGYMEAMTMNFDAPTPGVLRGLALHDAVRFRLHVTEEDSWVDGFQVLSNAGPAAITPAEVVLNDPTAVSFFRVVPELKEGDVVPDYALTNQLGQSFQLADYRGKVLAFCFIFTRCPMPDFCPRISARFRSAQNALKERPDAPPEWQLLSLSIDPLYDSPTVLTRYAQRLEADPARWMFGTGAYDQLQPLGSHFGLEFALNVTPDRLSHKLRTVVLDRAGRVQKILTGNDWTTDVLVQAIVDAGARK